jgi:hypothetical protein
MSYHDLEIELDLDPDELLAAGMWWVAAQGTTKRRRPPSDPRPDCLGWYPLGHGPGGRS